MKFLKYFEDNKYIYYEKLNRQEYNHYFNGGATKISNKQYSKLKDFIEVIMQSIGNYIAQTETNWYVTTKFYDPKLREIIVSHIRPDVVNLELFVDNDDWIYIEIIIRRSSFYYRIDWYDGLKEFIKDKPYLRQL